MSGPVKFLYAVVATERRADPALDLSHAPAAPAIGDIQVFDAQQGGDSLIQEQDHGTGGAIVDIVHLRILGMAREGEQGIEPDYELRRLLALIQIGAQHERAVHQLVDQVFERFEEYLDRYTREPELEHLERLRKEFP